MADRWKLLHTKLPDIPGAPAPCGGIAMYAMREFKHGDILRTGDFLLVNGTQPESSSPVICGSCNRVLDFRFLSDTLDQVKE